MFPEATIIAEYLGGKSTSELGKEYNTDPTTIRRIIVRAGHKLRSRSEAQALAIKQGKCPHNNQPKHTEESRQRIGDKASARWKNLSNKEKDKIREEKRSQWNSMHDLDKESMLRKAGEANLRAAKMGSKLEQYLITGLIPCYKVQPHAEFLIENEQMHIDILLPDVKIAIEVDGPTHFKPLYGEERLQRVQEKDNRKNGMLVQNGYKVIRLRNHFKHESDVKRRQLLQTLLNAIDVAKNSPELRTYLINVEE
jgi:very-short-patch-repair endonuclease